MTCTVHVQTCMLVVCSVGDLGVHLNADVTLRSRVIDVDRGRCSCKCLAAPSVTIFRRQQMELQRTVTSRPSTLCTNYNDVVIFLGETHNLTLQRARASQHHTQWSTLLMITLTIIRVNRISCMLHNCVYHIVVLFKLNNKQ